jgi:hypothetical protein
MESEIDFDNRSIDTTLIADGQVGNFLNFLLKNNNNERVINRSPRINWFKGEFQFLLSQSLKTGNLYSEVHDYIFSNENLLLLCETSRIFGQNEPEEIMKILIERDPIACIDGLHNYIYRLNSEINTKDLLKDLQPFIIKIMQLHNNDVDLHYQLFEMLFPPSLDIIDPNELLEILEVGHKIITMLAKMVPDKTEYLYFNRINELDFPRLLRDGGRNLTYGLAMSARSSYNIDKLYKKVIEFNELDHFLGILSSLITIKNDLPNAYKFHNYLKTIDPDTLKYPEFFNKLMLKIKYYEITLNSKKEM